MYVGLGLAVLALLGAWFIAPKLGVDMRARISLSALAAGLGSAITAGYMFGDEVGTVVVAASFISVAVLFGYERG
jgi:hypothetical protein